MKPVFLATCYFQQNYGSVLQALATQEFLDINSVPNQTINISGIFDVINKRKMAYFKRNIFNKDVVFDKLSYVRLVVNEKLNRKLGFNIQKRKRLFKEFSQSKFRLTDAFLSFSELSRACGTNAEAVLVGSDQLWLPTNIEADYYTLNFVPENIKRISYSTSFGVSSLPKEQAYKAAEFLNKIDYLSVREQSGITLIKDIIGKTPELVCDPVILLTAQQWHNLISEKPTPKEKYIFCYFLGKESHHYLWVKNLSKITGLKIIGITNLDTYIKKADKTVDLAKYDVDPFEFVNLIKNADFICTDSFHATVFSLLFHKKVFTFRRFIKKSAMSTNGRLESLYKFLGKSQPFTSANTPISEALKETLDYTAVDKVLLSLRSNSIKFLSEALNVELY